MSVDAALNRFGKVVVKEAKTALTKQDRNVSKELYNSIRFDSKVSKNSFELSIYMADHGKFLDQGVKGKSSSLKAPNSPFQFGSGTGKKGGLTKGIDKWVRARRIQFRDKKSGKFMSFQNTAFLIARSVYQKGTKETKFITKPFNAAYKNLPEEVVKAYGLQVEQLLKNVII
tara:strand:+ start:307 stop:822 length:516 start_codon:yes stop_codon:yes gene_type:complete